MLRTSWRKVSIHRNNPATLLTNPVHNCIGRLPNTIYKYSLKWYMTAELRSLKLFEETIDTIASRALHLVTRSITKVSRQPESKHAHVNFKYVKFNKALCFFLMERLIVVPGLEGVGLSTCS